jgi:hypothetical protein
MLRKDLGQGLKAVLSPLLQGNIEDVGLETKVAENRL